jgi:hypothetical protein
MSDTKNKAEGKDAPKAPDAAKKSRKGPVIFGSVILIVLIAVGLVLGGRWLHGHDQLREHRRRGDRRRPRERQRQDARPHSQAPRGRGRQGRRRARSSSSSTRRTCARRRPRPRPRSTTRSATSSSPRSTSTAPRATPTGPGPSSAPARDQGAERARRQRPRLGERPVRDRPRPGRHGDGPARRPREPAPEHEDQLAHRPGVVAKKSMMQGDVVQPGRPSTRSTTWTAYG